MTLRVYNTLTNQKEVFQTVTPGQVKMYICGPTVYGSAHIGHGLSYILFDAIRRYLEYKGYVVTHVQNFTDVDDKIIRRAHETGDRWDVLAKRYIDEFLAEMDLLNVKRAHVYPYASQEIPEIIEMIQGLIEKEFAYAVPGGDVYFRVQRDDDYGKLSNRRLEEQQAGARVAVDEEKEHPLDFVLWKAAKPGEPHWKSPWGPGRPGWHIECSAMSLHHLGAEIDIHGGGTDLIFPHHENEIAQTESYTGRPFARYWLHNGLLQMSGEKMARSVGNLIRIQDFLKEAEADAWRLFVLSSHYRRPVTYTPESFGAAERGLERFYAALQPVPEGAGPSDGAADEALAARAAQVMADFEEAMNDDFNTAAALGNLFEFAKGINAARDAGQTGPGFGRAQETLRTLLEVLGFRLAPRDQKAGVSTNAAPFIDLLVETRTLLRQAKQWALADQVRDKLAALGVILEDTAQGTTWRAE